MADDAFRADTQIPDMGEAYFDPLLQETGEGLTGPGGALRRYALRRRGHDLSEADFERQGWMLKRQPVYTEAEHERWRLLFENQRKMLPGRACKAFMTGFEALEPVLNAGVPDFKSINAVLEAATGWRVVPVPELIPDNVFFWHLENKRFPAGAFIRGGAPRTRKVIDANAGRAPEDVVYEAVEDDLFYLQEPDIFHDVFGHVPMLMDPFFADYIQAYGQGGRRAIEYNRLKNFGAIYWYTVEFGLILEEGELRIYGAGILSSPDETLFALYSDSPHRIKMTPERVMRTEYRIDDFQETYFVAKSFSELVDALDGDVDARVARVAAASTNAPGTVLPEDKVVTRGDGSYHAAKRTEA